MLLQDVTRKADRASPWAAWRRSLSWDWRITLFCYSALLPVLALFAYVRVVPIAESVALSFYRWDFIRPLKPFVGLTNYGNLMSDENYLIAMKNTLIYSFATVGLSTLLALPLADPDAPPAANPSIALTRRMTAAHMLVMVFAPSMALIVFSRPDTEPVWRCALRAATRTDRVCRPVRRRAAGDG
jgi:ABC-type sugar transport system permease subunit